MHLSYSWPYKEQGWWPGSASVGRIGDGSKHRWLQDYQHHDLIVISNDASSEIYYAQLLEEESARTVMAAWREIIEGQGLFFAL